ncbi:MAG: diphthamide synthesis protein [Candidatus Woesearchaeota archaeon]
MQTLCIEAPYIHEIKLSDDVLSYLEKQQVKTVALFASVQFMKLDIVKEQLDNLKITYKTTKAKRTHTQGQILGCDAYHDSFEDDIISECDCVLYVGDGYFHPKALLLSQIYKKDIKDVILWNPVLQKMEIISVADIKKQILKTKANLTRFVSAKSVGILVTVKPGQQYLKNAKRLAQQLKEQGKRAYIFVDDDIQISLLENYPFIDCWVNTACPRIGTDDITTIPTALINIREAWDPIKHLSQLHQTR